MTISRRELLQLAVTAGLLPTGVLAMQSSTMTTRRIPGTDESMPLIGLGTYSVFDVDGSDAELAERREIMEMLFEKGGSVIDTSPMYNRSERIIGEVLGLSNVRDKSFLATKVWTDGKAAGVRQMQRSADLMQTDVIDLMQVHNLRDTAIHMATIRDWQDEGRIRYNGITHYRAGALDAMEAAIRQHKPQFIQINYSLGEREADERLLPLCADEGIGVLINRPYMSGQLFSKVRGNDVPDWAQEFAASWGQFFLKYIVSHPAVHCAIPATSKARHMVDNLGAGFGPMPDAATRKRMETWFQSL